MLAKTRARGHVVSQLDNRNEKKKRYEKKNFKHRKHPVKIFGLVGYGSDALPKRTA